jgi:ABC-type sugar transport system substrate-binding protein
MYDATGKKPDAPGLRALFPAVLGAVLLCGIAFSAPAAALRAVYFIPKNPGDIFGDKLAGFMQAVAADLDIDLEIVRVHTDSSLIRNRQTLEAIKKDNKKIDIVLTHYDAASLIPDLAALAKSRDFVFVTFNIKPPQSDFQKIGRPREQYPRWIACLAPDDVSAGYQEARELSMAAQILFAGSKTIQMVAIGGSDVGEVNLDRIGGMRHSLTSETGITIMETVLTDWRPEQGYNAAAKFIATYPQAKIFWTASDSLALGAIDALEKKGMAPGRDFITGGIDWSDEGIQAVIDGKMAATVGGHFMEGGWALLLAFDYLSGKDFAGDIGVSITTPMHTLTAKNASQYAEFLDRNYWKQLDFRRFSKALNPELKKYDFSLEALMRPAPAAATRRP